MLPTFTYKQSGDRWFVETDWHVPAAMGARSMYQLQVTSGGRLDTASAGWATEDKARAAVEQCKRRLR